MKSYKPLTFAFAALVASALMLTSQSTFAQGAGGGGAGGGRGGMANFSEQGRQAMQDMNAELRDVTTKVTEARTALSDAIYAEKVDEAAIKTKAAALAKAQEEEALARAKAFAKVRSKFTAEEIDSIKRMGARGGMGGGARRAGGAAGQ